MTRKLPHLPTRLNGSCTGSGYQKWNLSKTDDAKRITIILEAETEKELMKWEDFGNNSKGIFHLFSFGGLDMSVLEAIQELQKLAKLDSKLDGEKLILSMKKKEK